MTWFSSCDDALDALEPEALGGQLRDRAQQLDVAQRVAAAATTGAAGRDQTEPVVGAQRLRVQPGQLGGDADHEDLRLRAGRDEVTHGRATVVMHLLEQCRPRVGAVAGSAQASTAASGRRSSSSGTCTSTVTSRSPLRAVLASARPCRGRGTCARSACPAGTLMRDRRARRASAPRSRAPSTASSNAHRHRDREVVALAAEQLGAARRARARNRSPFGPPLSPLAPLPLSRIRWPSLTPAGILTLIVRLRRRHDRSRGRSRTGARRRDRDRGTASHGSVIAKTPPDGTGLHAAALAAWGTPCGDGAGLWRRCRGRSGTARRWSAAAAAVAPSTACSKVIVVSVSRSSPDAAAGGRRARARRRRRGRRAGR